MIHLFSDIINIMMLFVILGPPDKTFKYHITPWPLLAPGEPINVTVTFTPGKFERHVTDPFTLQEIVE